MMITIVRPVVPYNNELLVYMSKKRKITANIIKITKITSRRTVFPSCIWYQSDNSCEEHNSDGVNNRQHKISELSLA